MNKHSLIEQIASDAGISLEEAEIALGKFKYAIEYFDEGRSSYELLVDRVSLYVPEDSDCHQEPLWVRNQQQKTFKRGKK